MNNELLVGGVFCDMEKVFDCGILLSELNLYGIKGKNHAFYQSYLDDRYFRTAMYRTVITVIKFQTGPKLDMESHKALFWGLYFFFYIYMT
jgi:hypothetical protein